MTSKKIAAVAIFLLSALSVTSADERIDSAGIGGSLVISGDGFPDEAIETFYKLAKGKSARVVIFALEPETAAEVVKAGAALGVKDIKVLPFGNDGAETTIEAVGEATGIWLHVANGDGALGSLQKHEKLRAEIRAMVQRGGVLGGGAEVAAAFGDERIGLRRVTTGKGEREVTPKKGLDLVGYEIDTDAALVVRGRRLSVVGGGGARLYLAKCESRPAKQIVLAGPRAVADLSALRFAAIARQAEPFPAEESPSPKVDAGTLIIIGGGSMPPGIIDRFVKLAGGDEASIIVLPTAIPDPVSERSSIANAFRKAGAKQTTVLTGRTLEKVDSDEYLKAFREATGIWFGGGRQWRFADAYLDTEALRAMHDMLARGGVIMGSSAGASIQADYLARANPLGNLDIMAEGYERGLGFIKGVAIDQHFAQRGRFKDMSSLVDRYSQLLGIGIDEGTALVVKGSEGEIAGAGRVHFYDRRRPLVEGEPDYKSVGDGGRYELVERKVIEAGKTKAANNR
jgi:cyanophycinase